jgi:hypothetical protein
MRLSANLTLSRAAASLFCSSAVLGPRLVGVPANRIPHFLRRLDGRRFSEWQAEVDAERHTRPGADQVRPITSAPSARRRGDHSRSRRAA